ncbi:MAG: creatininase family protein, partial [Hyphomicrobiales bacterium]
MTKRTPPCDWTDLDWAQTRTGDAASWIAVLPLAATEQHGPHLPLGTDIMIGEAYLAKVREVMPASLPAVIMPLQPVGISTEHLDFPGTLTLSAETAMRSWLALGESVARTGVKKFVMVTSHGGNSAAMTLVAQEL